LAAIAALTTSTGDNPERIAFETAKFKSTTDIVAITAGLGNAADAPTALLDINGKEKTINAVTSALILTLAFLLYFILRHH
jgi:hypothetical protein